MRASAGKRGEMGVGDGEGRRTGSFIVVYLIIEKLHPDTNTEEQSLLPLKINISKK